MEQKLHYKLFKNGKYLCTMALSTVVAITALGVTSVHADEVTAKTTDAQTTQTSQSAYQQKAAQNEQQLSDLAASNAAKETTAANSYAQANQQSANATSQQIADLQAQAAQKKQDAAQQIQAASDAMTSTITSQTQAVNNSAAAISNANAEYQTAVNNANASHQLATSAANADYTANINNENNTYNANQQQVKNGVTAAQNAVNQAQQAVKEHTTAETVTVPGVKRTIDHITNAAEKNGHSTNWGNSENLIFSFADPARYSNPVYYNLTMGQFAGNTPYSRKDVQNHTTKYDMTHVPTNVTEMPTDFQLGILIYNPDLDTSEVVSKDGLTAAQQEVLRAFMTSWANSFRNYIYNNDKAVWNEANKYNTLSNAPFHQLQYTTAMQQAGDEISTMRTQNHLKNDQHTIPSSNPNTDMYKVSSIQQLIDATKSYNRTSDVNHKTIEVGTTSSGLENLMTIEPTTADGAKPTMLNYLINAYNMTQAMWYGEIYADGLGGHVKSVLSNDNGFITESFQRLTANELATNPFNDNKLSDTEKSMLKNSIPVYAVTYNFYGGVPYLKDNDANRVLTPSDVSAMGPKGAALVDNYNKMMTATKQVMGSPVQNATFASAVSYEKNGNGSHTETKTVTPKEYTDALTNAQNNLKQTTADANSKLQQLSQTHQDHLKNLENVRDNAIKQADAALKQAVDHATKTRDAKIAEAQGSQIRVDELKDALNQKYQQLVKADQAKIAQIEADRQAAIKHIQETAKSEYDAKLKALGIDDQAVQQQIDALQQAHDAFVKANADKLAQLKANDLQAYNALKQQLDAELVAMLPRNQATVDVNSKDQGIINTASHIITIPNSENKSGVLVSASSSNTTPVVARFNKLDSNFTNNKENVAKSVETLPQTGNESSWGMILLGAAVSMFGLGLANRRNKQNY